MHAKRHNKIAKEVKTVNRRYIAAVILGTIGFLLLLGAVGSMEYGEIGEREAMIRGIIGMALLLVSAPVSGDMEKKNLQNERRKSKNENSNSL